MAYSSRKSSFQKILILVFGVAFGLVALALAYQAVKTSADIRSKAAATSQIYKQWEFNTVNSPEGWYAVDPYTATVGNGFFTLSDLKTKMLPAFQNTSAGVSLPAGLKKITFSMSVGRIITTGKRDTVTSTSSATIQNIPGKSVDSAYEASVGNNNVCALDVQTCTDGIVLGRGGPNCSLMACSTKPRRSFTGTVAYKLAGNTQYERPIAFSGRPDGRFQTFTLNLPNAESINIESILVTFSSGINSSDKINVDWIRVLGPIQPTPTPTPKPLVCGVILTSYFLSGSTVCTGGFIGPFSYACSDGYKNSEKLLTCTSESAIKTRASYLCNLRNSKLCGTPTPTPSNCTYASLSNIAYGAPVGACTPGSGYATTASFKCTDGYTSSIDSGGICNPPDYFKTTATDICAHRSSCSVSPTTTSGPVPTNYVTIAPTPTPQIPTLVVTGTVERYTTNDQVGYILRVSDAELYRLVTDSGLSTGQALPSGIFDQWATHLVKVRGDVKPNTGFEGPSSPLLLVQTITDISNPTPTPVPTIFYPAQ